MLPNPLPDPATVDPVLNVDAPPATEPTRSEAIIDQLAGGCALIGLGVAIPFAAFVPIGVVVLVASGWLGASMDTRFGLAILLGGASGLVAEILFIRSVRRSHWDRPDPQPPGTVPVRLDEAR